MKDLLLGLVNGIHYINTIHRRFPQVPAGNISATLTRLALLVAKIVNKAVQFYEGWPLFLAGSSSGKDGRWFQDGTRMFESFTCHGAQKSVPIRKRALQKRRVGMQPEDGK